MWQDAHTLTKVVIEKSDINKYIVKGVGTTWQQRNWPIALKKINESLNFDENNPNNNENQIRRKITTIYQDIN